MRAKSSPPSVTSLPAASGPLRMTCEIEAAREHARRAGDQQRADLLLARVLGARQRVAERGDARRATSAFALPFAIVTCAMRSRTSYCTSSSAIAASSDARERARSEQLGSLARRPRRVQPEVRERRRGRDPAARRALEQAALQQERLVHVFDGLRRLAHRDRERAEPDRPARRTCGTARRGSPGRPCRGRARRPRTARARRARSPSGDRAVGAHLGVVAHALQQAVRDARRAPRAARDLVGAVGLELDAEDRRDPAQDRGELVVRRSSRAGRRSRSGRAAVR